jgi:hypothetical protein
MLLAFGNWPLEGTSKMNKSLEDFFSLKLASSFRHGPSLTMCKAEMIPRERSRQLVKSNLQTNNIPSIFNVIEKRLSFD